jgi:hypothetical protein
MAMFLDKRIRLTAKALKAELAGGRRPFASLIVHRTRLWRELAIQAFTIECRRQLVGSPQPEAVQRFLAATAKRNSEWTVADNQSLASMVNWALEGVLWRKGKIVPARRMLLPILTDLVASRGLTANDVHRLVSTATLRIHRGLRQAGLRATTHPGGKPRASGTDEPRGPSSVAGQRLVAIATHNPGLLAGLPRCPDQDILLMLDLAFFQLVKRRFATDRDGIAILASSEDLAPAGYDFAASDVASVVGAELDGTPDAAIPGLTRDAIKFFVFAKLVDDVGMYDAELDQMLVGLESVAANSGHELVQMS